MVDREGSHYTPLTTGRNNTSLNNNSRPCPLAIYCCQTPYLHASGTSIYARMVMCVLLKSIFLAVHPRNLPEAWTNPNRDTIFSFPGQEARGEIV